MQNARQETILSVISENTSTKYPLLFKGYFALPMQTSQKFYTFLHRDARQLPAKNPLGRPRPVKQAISGGRWAQQGRWRKPRRKTAGQSSR